MADVGGPEQEPGSCRRFGPLDDAAIEFGGVELGDDGHIRRRPADRPLNFSFVHDDIVFRGTLLGSPSPRLRLTAELGDLPYSAQSPVARQLCRKALEASHRPGRPGRLNLRDHHAMFFEAEAVPPAPRNSISVIATATAMLLDIKPYLTLLAGALDMVGRPLAAVAGAAEPLAGPDKGSRRLDQLARLASGSTD